MDAGSRTGTQLKVAGSMLTAYQKMETWELIRELVELRMIFNQGEEVGDPEHLLSLMLEEVENRLGRSISVGTSPPTTST